MYAQSYLAVYPAAVKNTIQKEEEMLELELPTDSYSIGLEIEEHARRLETSPLKAILERADALILSNSRLL